MKAQRIILPLLLIVSLLASWAYHLYDKNTFQYAGGVSAFMLKEKLDQLSRSNEIQDSLHRQQLDSLTSRLSSSEQQTDSLIFLIDSMRSKHNALLVE